MQKAKHPGLRLLSKEAKILDHERHWQQSFEMFCNRCLYDRLNLWGDPIAECKLKTQFLHDHGIAPAVKIFTLPRVQIFVPLALRDFVKRQWRTKMIGPLHHSGGECQNFRLVANWLERNAKSVGIADRKAVATGWWKM